VFWLVQLAAAFALVSAALVVAGPLGYRLGLLSLSTAAEKIFVWGGTLGGLALVASVIGLAKTLSRHPGARRGIGRALLAIVVGGVAFRAAGRLPFTTPPPPLHDVTTDTERPPQYITVLEVHGTSGETHAYAGESVGAQQRQAYPDIQPLVLAVSREEAFSRALGAVRGLGWQLVAADGPAGRIEATATSRLFGTHADVVVRVSASEDGGSRVDVRSVSRESEGTGNAGRVRALLQAIREA
jgi:hypothetical protein